MTSRFARQVRRRLLVVLLLANALGLTVCPVAAAPAPFALPDNLTPIYVIQGDGPSTPLSLQRVSTLGLVSGVQTNGFYLQDPTGDDNLETSDGIFVYTSSAPRVHAGDCVLVRAAEVSEYYEKTELSWARAIETIPTELCGEGKLSAASAPLPVPNLAPASLLEPFEGMLVAFEELRGVVQGPTKRFRNGGVEIALIATQSLPFVRGGRVFQTNLADAAGLIFLSNGLGAELPDVAWGDRVQVRSRRPGTSVQAIIDFNFGKYLLLLLPGQEIEVSSRNAVAEQTLQPDAAAFRVCSFNVLGLGQGLNQLTDAAVYMAALRKRATAIADGLHSCEIIGLQETGTPDDAENLARVLADVKGLDYTAIGFAGPGSANPAFPLTNSLLVRTDRVTIKDARIDQGCTRFSFSVRLIPGRCPARQFPLFSRPPLVADLLVRGPWGDDYPLTVVVNHWESKLGDESANVVHRTLQAEHVASIVQMRLDADPEAHVVVLGDLNDFYASEPVLALQNGTRPALFHAFDALPPQDRYTYNSNGVGQALDHLLLSPGMLPHFGAVDIVRINADFPVARQPNPETVFGSSDHDPLVLTLRPGGSGWIAGNAQIANARVELVNSAGAVVAQVESDALGDFRFFDLRPGAYSLRFALPAHVAPNSGAHTYLYNAPLSSRGAYHISDPPTTVNVVQGQATVVEVSARHHRADTGAASAVFGIFSGVAAAPSAGISDP